MIPIRLTTYKGGKFHPKGPGTGQLFSHTIAEGFRERTPLAPIQTDDPAFSNYAVASAAEAQREAQRLNADYYFQAVLGEFRNAAPMTFRSDYLILSSAAMYRSTDGEIVWARTTPFAIEGNNLHRRDELIVQMARQTIDFFVSECSVHVRGSRDQVADRSLPGGAPAHVVRDEAVTRQAPSPAARLQELKQLRDSGAISEEEYLEKRRPYLDRL